MLIHSHEKFYEKTPFGGRRSFLWAIQALFFGFVLISISSISNFVFNWAQLPEQVLRVLEGHIPGLPYDRNSFTEKKILQPFTPLDLSGDTNGHFEKVAFRFVPYSIAHLLGFDHHGLIVLQMVIGIIFPAIIYAALRQAGSSVFISMTGLLLISLHYSGIAFFRELNFFDGIAYFFIAASMLPVSRSFIVLLSLLAAFTDERALASVGLVLIWHAARGGATNFIALRRALVTYLLFLIVYFVIRLTIWTVTSLETGTRGVGFDILQLNLTHVYVLVWSAFEGGWLLMGATVLSAIRREKCHEIALVGSVWIFTFVIIWFGFMVGDSVRSIQYAFPAMLIMILIGSRNLKQSFHGLSVIAIALSAATPITIYLGMDVVDGTLIYYMLDLVPGWKYSPIVVW